MEHQPFFLAILIAVLLSFFLVFRTWKKSNTNSSIKMLPPGPWRLPIIGNMHQLLGSLPHRRLRDLANKYGPLMFLQLGEVSHVVVSSPEAAKEVMKTHDILFLERPFILGASIIFYNCSDIAFAPYGEHWRQLRKICILELLSAKRVQLFRSIREEEVSHLIQSISSSGGSVVNLSRMLLSLSNNVIWRTAFGDFGKRQQDAFLPLVDKCIQAIAGFSVADFFPSIKLLHVISGLRPKFERLHKKLDVIFENIINEHKAKRAREKHGAAKEANDLVDVLLNIQQHGNLEFPLTSEAIKAVILDMFLAGTETSATTIEWAMSEMLKNPRVLEKAQAEVRQVFDGKEIVNETSIHELKYLNLVIKETLRLHPPAPLLAPRESRERVEINGYEIPAKTKVVINGWMIGRDPHYWIEAERFYPERFVGSSIDYKGNHFEFIPFGSGRRMCPGMLYGVALIEIALANLLYHFDWKLPGGAKPEDLDISEGFGVTAKMKNGLNLIPMSYHPLPLRE